MDQHGAGNAAAVMIGKGQTVACGQVLQEGKPQPLDIQIADVVCQMDEAEQAHTYNTNKRPLYEVQNGN